MTSTIPPYQVRVSTRAKMVRLTISREKGLMVTVPRGFRVDLLPDILAQKQDWIDRTIQKINQTPAAPRPPALPSQMDLLSVREKWSIVYRSKEGRSASIRQYAAHVLVVEGCLTNKGVIRKLLKGWLHQQAERILPDWLERVSCSTGLKYTDVSIRDQKTRWGSCSAQKNISLNQKLIFLPPELVDYILVHELCHTVQMSHSIKFWALVEKVMPDYKQRRKLLREYEKKISW
jgi:predicted metal-dependent hydrolase